MEEIILQKARQMVARVREKILGEGFSVEKCIPELMKITNETALDVYKVLIFFNYSGLTPEKDLAKEKTA